MRNLVIIYFVLINLAGFTLALLDNSDSPLNEGSFYSISRDIRFTTASALGGGIGTYAGCLVGGMKPVSAGLKTAVQILIVQNLFSLVIALRAFRGRRRKSDYSRSSF